MNGSRLTLTLFTSLFCVAAAATVSAQDKAEPDAKKADPRVVLEIEQAGEPMGKIVIELDPAKAPGTVKNFLRYVDEGYYNGTVYHRIIPTFMIQGGGFTADYQKKTDGLHESINNEARNGLKNTRGTIAMARTGQPHSATAQFFINVVDNALLDYPGRDGWGYCVFGKVVEGMEVVDKIKAVATRPNRAVGGAPAPLKPVVIKKAERVKADPEKKDEPKPADKEKPKSAGG